MSELRAALRYAKAILDTAKEKKALDAVEKDMRSIATTISESKELREVLASPIIANTVKKDALLNIFKGVDPITEGAISVLVDNKRVALLNEVALKYIILNEDLKGKGVAYVTTAIPLDAAMEKKVLAKVAAITKNEVTIENIVDESVLGGFILRIGDLQFDASIANKLSNLKREFSNSL